MPTLCLTDAAPEIYLFENYLFRRLFSPWFFSGGRDPCGCNSMVYMYNLGVTRGGSVPAGRGPTFGSDYIL